MIEISDDKNAAQKAEKLVREMNRSRKQKELKRKQEFSKIQFNIQNSIEEIKKDRIDNQDRMQYQKKKNIFERLDGHEKKKKDLLSSENNNTQFIKKLFKSPHYFKLKKNDSSPNVILPHLSKKMFSPQIIKEIPKKKSKSPEKNTIKPSKLKMNEYLKDRMEQEERILSEREKILIEEKKMLEIRKIKFEEEQRQKKLIDKELKIIDKTLNNYKMLRKSEGGEGDIKKNQVDVCIQAIDQNIDECLGNYNGDS